MLVSFLHMDPEDYVKANFNVIIVALVPPTILCGVEEAATEVEKA